MEKTLAQNPDRSEQKWVPKPPTSSWYLVYEPRVLGRRLADWAPNQGSLEEEETRAAPRWLPILRNQEKMVVRECPGDTAWAPVAAVENWT